MSDSKTTADRLARAHTGEAMGWILEVGRSSLSKDADRLRAAQLILEMGHGKPTQAVISIPAKGAAAQRLAQYSTDKLLEMIEARGGMEALIQRNAIDGEFAEVPTLAAPTAPDDGSDLI
jgi:hypothetical protein